MTEASNKDTQSIKLLLLAIVRASDKSNLCSFTRHMKRSIFMLLLHCACIWIYPTSNGVENKEKQIGVNLIDLTDNYVSSLFPHWPIINGISLSLINRNI